MGMFTKSENRRARENIDKGITDIAQKMTDSQLALALLLKIGASSRLGFTDHPFAKEATKRCGCDEYGSMDTMTENE